MAQQKLLHRERIIQVAGVLLMLSPFFNFYISVYTMPPLPNKWSLQTFWSLAFGGSLMVTGLWLLSFVIGLMMIKGRRASWLPVLMLFGLYIVVNVMHFKRDIQSGWAQPLLSLAINIGLFVLIYTQEFYQIRQAEIAAQKPHPLPLGPVVKFDGHGTWARLLELTPTHIRLQRISSPPDDIELKPLEVILSPELVLPARFVENHDNDYLFQFIELSQTHREQLKQWILRPQKAVA